ncbi:jerky protein homolog-like [Uloborus diversus]|uniref:jerky protein homolog-like n=1 Tax=Uloborus diversus TaxID=327109 RepID=UPI00240A917E|nr:jerky protein homolog-like [Uloborus diversus]
MASIKRKRIVLTIQEKYDIVTRLESGEAVTKLAKEFHVGVSTVSEMKRNSEKIKKCFAEFDITKGAKFRKTMKLADHTDLDATLYKWFVQKRCEGIPLSGPMIQEKALILNSKLGGSDDFKASSGWLEKFKIRHGIRQLNIEGEKLSGNVAAVDSFVAKIEDLIRDENLSPDQIYNCDETGLYWKALPEETLAAVNETSAPGRKRMKDRVTVLACSNA